MNRDRLARSAGEDRKPIVLPSPQHYHAVIFGYASMNGENFVNSTRVELIGNDLRILKEYAREIADRPNQHVYSVTQCADETHLKGL